VGIIVFFTCRYTVSPPVAVGGFIFTYLYYFAHQ
jgi:hypothetical protein